MIQCLIHEKGFPKGYWAKASNVIVFSLNRVSTKAIYRITHFEDWYGNQIKIFGCMCFTYVL